MKLSPLVLLAAGAGGFMLFRGRLQRATVEWTRDGVVQAIVDAAVERGLGERLGHALVVNAWHESRLDPMAIGDNGDSVGLFQLNSNGGGRGMTVAQRQDVDLSIARFLDLCEDQPRLMQAVRDGRGTDHLAGLVAELVERCDGCGCDVCSTDTERRARVATAASWYPSELDDTSP